MKFWEGAILVIGGLWLIGRMSRQSASHPVAVAVSSLPVVAPGLSGIVYPTGTSATAGISAGEPISPAGNTSLSQLAPVVVRLGRIPVVHPTYAPLQLPYKFPLSNNIRRMYTDNY